MDDPVHDHSPDRVRWTTTNIGEAFTDVVTPLTWTLWGPLMDRASRAAYHRLGVLTRSEAAPHVDVGGRFSAVFFGRPALNVDLIALVGDRVPGTSGAAAVEQLLGSGYPTEDRSTLRRLPAMAVGVPRVMLRRRSRVQRFLDDQRAWWSRVTNPTAPAVEPRVLLRHAAGRLESALAQHSVASMVTVGLLDRCSALAARAGAPELATVVNTGHGQMEESSYVTEVWEVSRGRMTVSEVARRHGYHGPGELALTSLREDPALIEELAERVADEPGDHSPDRRSRAQAAARATAQQAVLAALPRSQRVGARAIFRAATTGVPLREATKASFVMALDAARLAARAHGTALSRAGAIDEPDHVFWLTVDEVLHGCGDAGARVAQRLATHEKHKKVKLPATWCGDPAPDSVGERAAESLLPGVPVYTGVVEGPVRVAHTVAEALAIRPGEILVCSTTDPSWASVFPLSSALAIDHGSSASHGAIVARELGIPCVINTVTGTAQLRTGDLVRLDGAAGTVEVLEVGERTAT